VTVNGQTSQLKAVTVTGGELSNNTEKSPVSL